MYCMQFKNKLVQKLFLLFLQNSFWGCPVIWPDIKGCTLLQVKFPVFTPHVTNVLSKGGCGRHRREMPCEWFGAFALLISSAMYRSCKPWFYLLWFNTYLDTQQIQNFFPSSSIMSVKMVSISCEQWAFWESWIDCATCASLCWNSSSSSLAPGTSASLLLGTSPPCVGLGMDPDTSTECQGVSETGNMLHPSTHRALMYLQNGHSRG